MAGGFGFKLNPKNKSFSKKNNNSEILKDSSDSYLPKKPNNFSGILFPGQSVDINPSRKEPKNNWSHEFATKTISVEQSLFLNQHTQEIKNEIQDLRLEISKLIQSSQNLDQEIIQAVEQNIPQANEYQLSFLQRIKKLIISFRQEVDQSFLWMESLNHKKSRKNSFWGNVRNKKNGGEQYLMSGEHSVSRSAN
jgi:hypothetical protein